MSVPQAQPFAEAIAANHVTVGSMVPTDFTVDEWTFITQAAQFLTLGDKTPEQLGEEFNKEFDKAMMLKAE